MWEDQLKVTEWVRIFPNVYTRYVWIYPLKYKSEAFEKFREWRAKTELEAGKKLKVFRSDNGGEFTSKEFECFLKKEGIKHQLTVPKCPEQNGKAERMNRTLIEMVRSMLSHFKLPHKFWAETLSTAAYLRNRCPTKALPDKTPYEALTAVKPKVGRLRVFGCAAYRHIPKDERQKLDAKSQKCIFMGYANERRGYRLYDNQKERIVFSRDVTFNEMVTGLESKPNAYIQYDLIDDDYDHIFSDNEEREDIPDPEPVIRRSSRSRNPPDRYGVYVNLTEMEKEPTSVAEALAGSNKDKWKSAMDAEFNSLKSNDVWELVDPPKDCNIVSCKWVFRHKFGEDGSIERHKARLVAQGYSQRHGQDYEETFSPVVKFESIRTVIALAAKKNLLLHQMDVDFSMENLQRSFI